jgi:hypothetical protein
MVMSIGYDNVFGQFLCPALIDYVTIVNSFNPSVTNLEFWQGRLLKLTKKLAKYLKKHCPDNLSSNISPSTLEILRKCVQMMSSALKSGGE